MNNQSILLSSKIPFLRLLLFFSSIYYNMLHFGYSIILFLLSGILQRFLKSLNIYFILLKVQTEETRKCSHPHLYRWGVPARLK